MSLITVAEKKRPELAKTIGDEPETGAKGKKKTATEDGREEVRIEQAGSKTSRGEKEDGRQKSAK